MNAWVLKGISDLRLEEVNKPVPAENEVLVAVKAVGICGSDIPRIYRTGAYAHPLIPGHEFSGVVKETGSQVDKGWLGKRVGIYPLIACGDCVPCKKKQYEMCRNYSYLGSRRNGGFAEYVVVPVHNLIELPDTVPYEVAAMMEPMAVAVHAVRQAQLNPGQTTAIYGLGSIGLMVAMFIRQMGVHNLFVIGNKDLQLDLAKGFGMEVEFCCDSRIQEPVSWLMNHTNGQGVDVVFECVGNEKTVNDAINCAAPGGFVQLIGNPALDICFEKNTYWKILRNQLTVKGSWNSTFTHESEDDWHFVLEHLKAGSIKPEKIITHKLLFETLEAGTLIMRDKREEYGKVMITVAN